MYFTQIILGLHHLHNNSVIHRDIKPQNILVDNLNGVRILKIGDFGLSKVDLTAKIEHIEENKYGNPTAVYGHQGETTIYYRSPELFDGKEPTEKADIWAAGVVLYRLCYRKQPFFAPNGLEPAIMKNILMETPNFSNEVDSETISFLKKLLDKNPDTRISTKEILEDPIMKPYILKFLEKLSEVDIQATLTIVYDIVFSVPSCLTLQ